MLEIYINKQKVDISEDTSISLVYNNPFMTVEGIPMPYSLSFDLPRTTNNLALFKNSHRVAATRRLDPMPTRICYDGLNLINGEITVGAITKEAIELNFNSSEVITTTKKYLHEQDLGSISFGNATWEPSTSTDAAKWNTYLSRMECISYWENQALMDYPQFVAPPMAVSDFKWMDPDVQHQNSNLNQRTFRVNNYGKSKYMIAGFGISKILPSIQLLYILQKINSAFAPIFNNLKLRRLMLVSSFHPTYQVSDNSPVWDFNSTTGECSIKIADFMPQITTGDFIVECLKLICASIFVTSEGLTADSRSNILQSTDVDDWTGKVIDTPTVEIRHGQYYKVEYQESSTEEPIPPDRVIENIDSVGTMVRRTAQNALVDNALKTYRIEATGQIYEQHINNMLSNATYAHYDYELIKDQLDEGKYKEDESNSFDVSLNVSPVRMIVATDMVNDMDMVPYFSLSGTTNHDYIYCPEIEVATKTRPDKIMIGTYLGKRSTSLFTGISYPLLVGDNCDADGVSSFDNVSLELGGEKGLIKDYHKPFQEWIEKDKLVLTADVILSPIDLKNLDLRRKIHLRGRNFFIEELSVTIKSRSIEPAEVTFVEA